MDGLVTPYQTVRRSYAALKSRNLWFAWPFVDLSNLSFIGMVTENQNFVQCPDLCDVRSLPIVDIENVKVSRFKAVWERQPLGGCFGRTLTVRTRLAPLLVASMVFECCMTNLSMLPCASIHAFPPVSQTVACTRLRHVNAE